MKNKSMNRCLLNAQALLSAAVLFGSVHQAASQGSAFTYQGRLGQAGNPANGSFDLTLTLFAASAGGSPLAEPLTNSGTAIIAGMFTITLDFGRVVFDGGDRWLEVAVRAPGEDSFTTLSPRQRLTASPYAITAGAVTGPINGGSIIGGTITASQLASNSITGGQLAAGAAAANLAAGGQAGVAAGGMVLSASENPALVAAGYSLAGSTVLNDAWTQRGLGSPQKPRSGHAAVWTGSEMIVWGGQTNSQAFGNSVFLDDGARYNPLADTWTAISRTSAPSARANHVGVWTGTELLVWGGSIGNSFPKFNDGARYSPAMDSWHPITTNGAPSARSSALAVWTGAEMIVWGGNDHNFQDHNDGARYNPQTDSWVPMAPNNGTGELGPETAVWTGTQMIVWGFNQGACGRYDPSSNAWLPISTNGAPSPRAHHCAIWTGGKMIIWGGDSYDQADVFLQDGAAYDPANDIWRPLSGSGVPIARNFATAVWTGKEMIVWGGLGDAGYLNDGGVYKPDSDSWCQQLTTVCAPLGRASHTALWIGSQMIIFGGAGDAGYFGDTWLYTPSRRMFLYQKL
jgi:N-acetylneuraminic acid mutarotase